MPRRKKPMGRPPKYTMPEKIKASPEEIADVVLRAKLKKDWDYEKKQPRGR